MGALQGTYSPAGGAVRPQARTGTGEGVQHPSSPGAEVCEPPRCREKAELSGRGGLRRAGGLSPLLGA